MGDMQVLWSEARLYGRVGLHTNDRGTYWCQITFETIKHTKLEVSSEYCCPSPVAALIQAIEAAKAVVASLESQASSIRSLTDG